MYVYMYIYVCMYVCVCEYSPVLIVFIISIGAIIVAE